MKDNIKKKYVGAILFILLALLIYISNISNMPENIVLFEGEPLNIKTVLGINITTTSSTNPNIEKIENKQTITVSANTSDQNHTGNLNLQVSFLGIKVKNINVDIIENAEVVPIGNLIGVKLYTNGVLVVGMSEIEDEREGKVKPYEGSGIEEGDIIVGINENIVTCTDELTKYINEAKGNDMKVTYIRNGEELNTNMKAVQSSDNSYKIGLWVRDTAAGVRYC
ncbi:MAG: PDZ domain-containing protein [Clostridia bacterium]|nr:PDZ domain-containing protein [Clostridia bacterium]